MNKDRLKDEGNALITQKHQISKAQGKLTELHQSLDIMQNEQAQNRQKLDSLMSDMEALLADIDPNMAEMDSNQEQEALISLQKELDSMQVEIHSDLHTIDELDSVVFNENMSWGEYINSFNDYAKRNHIDLSKDPFENLMSKTQQIELQKRIKEEFSIKNAQCDKYDYLIAGACGLIGGLVDILFVGKPGESKLGGWVDEQANNATKKFAKLCGWKPKEGKEDSVKSAIGFLEKKFKVNYDHRHTADTGGKVCNMSAKNHHLKSLGHSPDIIGLFFSILNQFTNTATFVSNGEIITIDTYNFELQGGNFIAKIFCGFANWFGHLASDWTGSSGADGRGSGIPIPFYNLFQLCDFGRFGEKHQETFAVVTSKVFESGYDFRRGLTMAIPVVITELIIRFMYVMKQRFYHGREWKECMPNSSVPELRRMLLVGHGVLCTMDGIDAAIRSGGPLANPVEFLLHTNLIGWVNFGQLALREVYAWWNVGKMDIEAVDEYLGKDLRAMIRG